MYNALLAAGARSRLAPVTWSGGSIRYAIVTDPDRSPYAGPRQPSKGHYTGSPLIASLWWDRSVEDKECAVGRGRVWAVEQKRAIVAEYESAAYGSKGAVLRRHGVVAGQVHRWASYRDAGVLETGVRKGWQKRMTPRSESAELGRLRAQVVQLEQRLERAQRDRVVAEAASEALGKASALLQLMLQSAEPSSKSELS